MEYFLSGVVVRSARLLINSCLYLNLSSVFLQSFGGGELLPLLFAIEKFKANLFNSVDELDS